MVVAADKALQKRLAAGAMAAGGAVQTFASLDEAPARVDIDLALVELAPRIVVDALTPPAPPVMPPAVASLAARLPDGARLVPILPAPDLEWMTALLADARVPCRARRRPPHAPARSPPPSPSCWRATSSASTRCCPGACASTRRSSATITRSRRAIAAIGDFAQAMGVRRKYREQIDQCIDEMLMNALYDAPVDDEGKPLFADVPVRERVLMRADEKAIVQYGCDGERFAVSVRDAFGTLRKETILQLPRQVPARADREQIDRKAGGAGLGLYLICNSASEVGFHIFAGSATEVICSFDLTAAARAAARARRLRGAASSTRARATGAVTHDRRRVAAAATRTWRRAAPPPRAGAAPAGDDDVRRAAARLRRRAGGAALPAPAGRRRRCASRPIRPARSSTSTAARAAPRRSPSTAEAGRTYAVRAVRPGFRDDEQLVTAAAGDAPVRLHLERLAATLAVETEPAGARVFVDGKETGKLTPATLELPPATPLTLTLRKEGFVESSVTTTAPPPGEHALYHTALPLEGAAALLTVTTEPRRRQRQRRRPAAGAAGAVARHLRRARARATRSRRRAPGFVDARAEVTVAGGEHKSLHLQLVEGGTLALRINVAAKVLVDGKPVGNGAARRRSA